jgi:hypothetical protein
MEDYYVLFVIDTKIPNQLWNIPHRLRVDYSNASPIGVHNLEATRLSHQAIPGSLKADIDSRISAQGLGCLVTIWIEFYRSGSH